MATVDLIPDADGTVQQWDVFPGIVTHWETVDDPVGTPDEDTSYVYTDVDAEIEEFNHKTSGLLIGATITNVRVNVRAKTEIILNTINIGVRIGITRYAAAADTGLTTSYADYFKDWANNPAGGSWTKSAIDGLQSSIQSTSLDVWVRVTQVYLTVTYTPTAANPLIGKPFVSPDMIKKAIIR